MPEFSFYDNEALDKLLDETRIKTDTAVKQLKPILYINREGINYSFLNEYGLTTILASYKGGKSFLMWLICMLLRKVIGNPMFISEMNPGERIGFFDTEQGRQRVHLNLNKFFLKEYPILIDAFSLREIQIMDILPLIKHYIVRFKPRIIFIDISSDLVTNNNDLEQSNLAVNELSATAEKYGVHIVCSLHLSRSGEATGHIGSSLLKRSELVMQIKRIKNVYCVQPRYARDEPFPSFGFVIQDGMPVLVETIPSSSKHSSSGKSKKDFESVSLEKHFEILKDILPGGRGLRPKEFKTTLRTAYGAAVAEIGELLVRELQRFYVSKKLIVKKEGLLYLQSESMAAMDAYFDEVIT